MNRKRVGILAAGGAVIAIAAGIGGTFASFTHTKASAADTATAKKLFIGDTLTDTKVTGEVAPGKTIVDQDYVITNGGDMAGKLSMVQLLASMNAAQGEGDNGKDCTAPEDKVEGGFGCDADSELPGYLDVLITSGNTVLYGTTASVGNAEAKPMVAAAPGGNCFGSTGPKAFEGPCAAGSATSIPIAANATAKVHITVKVRDTGTSGADNIIQGDKAQLTFSARLDQA